VAGWLLILGRGGGLKQRLGHENESNHNKKGFLDRVERGKSDEVSSSGPSSTDTNAIALIVD